MKDKFRNVCPINVLTVGSKTIVDITDNLSTIVVYLDFRATETYVGFYR